MGSRDDERARAAELRRAEEEKARLEARDGLEALRAFRGRAVAGFLTKPYRFRELAEAVRAALARGAGQPKPGPRPPEARAEWGPECETGHPALNLQHRNLVQAFNLFAEAAVRGLRGETEQSLARLIETCMTHFGVEESLMAATAYPEAREHQALHAQLIAQVQVLERRIRQTHAPLTPALPDFIQDWIVLHIQTEDKLLGRHLGTGGH
jgi:hemerythrin-like metal-binding protein